MFAHTFFAVINNKPFLAGPVNDKSTRSSSLRCFYPPAYELRLIVNNIAKLFPALGRRAVYNLFKKH